MHAPPPVKLYVEGRYRKLTRDLPQTIFFCPVCKGHPRRRKNCESCEGFGKLTRDSVQELIGWVLGKMAGTRKHKFHGAGREDVDVRMLGEGRPFVFELLNPKVTRLDLAEAEELINDRNDGRLEVRGLHWSEKPRVRVLKEGEFAKEYRALVRPETPCDLEPLRGRIGEQIELEQDTPSRVAHRRADKTRMRWIELLQVEGPVEGRDDGAFTVDLRTQHGTYVKEAISGETGRTRPSLGELLGTPCTCEELDVLEILGLEAAAPPPTRRLRFGAGLE